MSERKSDKGSRKFQSIPGGKATTTEQKPAKAKPGRPPVPSWVPPEGRRFVRKLMPQLEADGLLDAKFAGGLAAIASVYAIMAMAMKQLEKDGITVADPDHPAEGDGNEGKKRAAVRKHPLISVVMAASEKLTTWSKEFGLTPAACKRLMEEEAPGRKRGGGKLGRFLAE